MSSKGIYEADGKKFLANHLKAETFVAPLFAHVAEDTDLDGLTKTHPWLLEKVSGNLIHVQSFARIQKNWSM